MAERWENPMGTDGFEFIEYAAPDPGAMGALFESIELDQMRRGVL
jgi:4-hydroxyphenylpyruvate dioxygenase